MADLNRKPNDATGLPVALLVLRYSLAAFLAIWVVEKLIKPDTTAAIWKAFYMVENLPAAGSYAVGGLQALALLAFVFGFKKFWSYGFWVIAHGVGTVLTYDRLLDPYTGVNHLFWAAVPVLGAFVALFLLRKQDTLLAVDR